MDDRLNVLLVVVDTLRADHLGCYGYRRNTSPNIDALAAKSVVFDNMFAPAIPTHPSFTCLYTGQYSITHGIVAIGGDRQIPRAAPWLPKLLLTAGYTTCAIDNLVDAKQGFCRGFEYYIDPSQRRPLALKCDNRQINERALPWITEHADEPFFMMVHYWDPHTPYMPPRAYRTLFYDGDPANPANRSLEKLEEHPLGQLWRDVWFNKLGGTITDAEYIEALYDGEIRYCDEGIAELLAAIDRAGIGDNTVVILTADHGELMFRHGIYFDHHGLYDGNLHVPLIVRHPSFQPRRIDHFVEHVDLAPTILNLCKQPIPKTMEGVSLAPLLRGISDNAIRDRVISQECTWQIKWSIRTHTHKFISAREKDFYGTPMKELYDLKADPNETHNIVEREPETAKLLESQLEDWIADMMKKNGLTEDPLVRHGMTLGMKWKESRRE